MSIRKILYPVDLTGSSTANRIENEYITIGTDKYRAFTLGYAPFFADGLTLRERKATTLLKEGTDYEVLYFFSDLTKLTGGKRICGVVCITNTKVGTDLVAGYNTVGGHYANCASIIQQAIFDLNLDNREAYWQSVIDKPDLFQPTPHIHDIGDVYGLEFQIDTLIAIREAIMIGDNKVHAQILARIDEAVDEFKQYHTAHLADVTNPHKTTAHQVGAYTKEEIDELFMEIMNDFGNLEPRFKNIADGITDIYSKISAVNAALKGMSDRIGLVEQELSKFVLLFTPINQTLTNLQGEIDNIYQVISSLQAKDKNLQDQINAVELKNTKQDERLTSLESFDSDADSRLDALEKSTADIEKSITALTKAIGEVYVKWSQTTKDKLAWSTLIGNVPFITTDGNMEIGSTVTFHHPSAPDPAVQLYVEKVSMSPGASTLYNTGYFNCQDIWIRSDLRDKRNVRPYSLSSADEVLRAIGGGIRYQLGAEDEFTVGLAAQVVQKHLPEAVRLILNEKNQERLTLRESAMVGVLVSGYNHQAAEIDELKKLVAKLLEKTTEVVTSVMQSPDQ